MRGAAGELRVDAVYVQLSVCELCTSEMRVAGPVRGPPCVGSSLSLLTPRGFVGERERAMRADVWGMHVWTGAVGRFMPR